MQQIKVQYPILRLLLATHTSDALIAMSEQQTMRVGSQTYLMAGQFANKFQETYLDEGSYAELIPFFQAGGDWELKTILVEFKSTKSIAYKHIELEFFYLVKTTPRGFWINIPVLNAEAFVAEVAEIEPATKEAILLNFTRTKKLDYLQNVLATMWFYAPEIHKEEISLTAYSLNELENLQTQKKQTLLPFVAKKIELKSDSRQLLFGEPTNIKRVADILKSKYNRSTILVGKSGVGKTTLVWELVRAANKYGLKQAIWETTASTMIKELTQQAGWQQNLTLVCQELRNLGDVLFVRNMLELFEVGQYEGNSISMAEYMREYIARGEITLISECTDEEFARIEMRSPNFSSFFNIVRIEEPTNELSEIIHAKVKNIAADKKIPIETDAIAETVRLNKRYTPYSGFPGKPIRFLESILVNSRHLQSIGKNMNGLDRETVIQAFCDETGMPNFIVNPRVPMDLAQVSNFFRSNVFGQNKAIDILVDLLASVKTAVLRSGKPIASLLFVGPTGVGKTELAKVLAEFMFGSREKMLRFDMSEYSTSYAVQRLVGESYFADGVLTSAVRRDPFAVVLFDELEKAHPDFNDLLLQMLGEGRLTDSQGKVVNFCSTIIIMTSNIGAKKLQTSNVGWASNETEQTLADFFENEARKFFRPEIFNRLDQIIPFASLDRSVIRKVVEREVAQLRRREGIQGRNLEWKFSEEVYDYLGELGYKPKYGARALQRALQEEVIIPLSKQLNEYPFLEKLVVDISMKNDRLHVEVEADPLKMDLMLEELTQHEFMDYASGLRQAIYRLLEGNAYTQFSGNLRTLKHDQLRRPKIFWANADNPRQLAYYTNIDERIQVAKQEMDATETDMALITMGLRPLNTLFYDKIKAWDTSYFELKVELLALIRPELNSIQIGIYGKKSAEIFKLYVQMLEAKNYAWEAQTVWYRESLYNKLIEQTENSAETDEAYDDSESDSNVYLLPSEHPEKAKTAQKSKQYYKKPFIVPNPNDKDKDKINNYKIDEKGDVFMGLELMIMGFGVAHFFGDEGGQQRIAGETEKSNYEKVFVALNQAGEMFKTPDEIHRQNCSVWQMRSRRTFHQEAFEDATYKIPKRRLTKGTEVELLLEVMNKRFSKRIDEELGA